MPHTCSRCGSHIPEGHTICPTCGAPAPRSSRYVRCSHCLHRAPAGLAVCPHCGRELKPWRMDKWVIAFSLIILAGLWLFIGGGIHTVGQVKHTLAQALPPRMTPVTQDIALAPTPTPRPAPTTIVIPTPTTVTQAAGPTASPTKPIPNPTKLSPTPLPSSTPTATATNEPSPTNTPAPTATTTPTQTPTSKPRPGTYVVKAGDTLITIAQDIDRDVDALAAYNNISDPTTIYVGQELKIPPAGYTPPTPTPKRPTKTPTPTHTPTPSITLPAPALIDPSDNAPYGGADAIILLKWQALPMGIPQGAEYVVHIGVQVGPEPQIDWRVVEPVGYNTSYQVPAWLFGQAPQEYGRTYFWYVQVANVTRNGDKVDLSPISPPSERRKFYWN